MQRRWQVQFPSQAQRRIAACSMGVRAGEAEKPGTPSDRQYGRVEDACSARQDQRLREDLVWYSTGGESNEPQGTHELLTLGGMPGVSDLVRRPLPRAPGVRYRFPQASRATRLDPALRGAVDPTSMAGLRVPDRSYCGGHEEQRSRSPILRHLPPQL